MYVLAATDPDETFPPGKACHLWMNIQFRALRQRRANFSPGNTPLLRPIPPLGSLTRATRIPFAISSTTIQDWVADDDPRTERAEGVLDRKVKPVRSLERPEALARRCSEVKDTVSPHLDVAHVTAFAADHGGHRERQCVYGFCDRVNNGGLRGAKNLQSGAAMSVHTCESAVEVGHSMARQAVPMRFGHSGAATWASGIQRGRRLKPLST